MKRLLIDAARYSLLMHAASLAAMLIIFEGYRYVMV